MTDTPKVGDWLLYFSLWKGYQAIQITKITPQRLYGDFEYRKWVTDVRTHGPEAFFSSDKTEVEWLAGELNFLAKEQKEALQAVYDDFKLRRERRFTIARNGK